MVKMSARSWHVRLVRWLSYYDGGTYIPTNICSHFWVVVATLFIQIPTMVCMAAFCLGVPMFILWVIWMVFVVPYWSFFLWLAMLLAVISVVSVGAKKYRERARSTEAPPNLLLAYLKAKKERLCTRIELVEE